MEFTHTRCHHRICHLNLVKALPNDTLDNFVCVCACGSQQNILCTIILRVIEMFATVDTAEGKTTCSVLGATFKRQFEIYNSEDNTIYGA